MAESCSTCQHAQKWIYDSHQNPNPKSLYFYQQSQSQLNLHLMRYPYTEQEACGHTMKGRI